MPTLINAHATPAAKRLLDYLAALPAGYILTGQHNYPGTISGFTERVQTLTGKYPAVWGQDFGFAGYDDKDSIYVRDEIVTEAIRQHEQGAIITLMWHCVRPTDDEPGTFTGNVLTDLAEGVYDDLVTPGTAVYQHWVEQADVIAGYLKQLQQADIPVLWRPYHEMNGNWFWWGHKPGTRFIELWKQNYHRFTDHHQLHNLIWVWNTNAPNNDNVLPYAAMFPGQAYADILATDIYGGNYQQQFHDDLLTLAEGKPIAIGECGEMPLPEVIERQPHWRWFMTWSELMEEKNSLDKIQAVYRSPNAIHRDDTTLSWKVWQTTH